MKTQNKITTLLILLLVLSGCKSSRQIATITTAESKAATADFLDLMLKQSYTFQTLSARTNMEFKLPGQELSSRVDIKMVKDASLQLSIQPMLGIEAFKMDFGPDSIKIIDRLNKQYLLESYNSLKAQTQVDLNLYNLQALITNNIFIPGMPEIKPAFYNKFDISSEGRLSKVRINDAAKILYTFISESGEKLLSTNIDDTTKQYSLKWLYSDFKNADGKTFPMKMNMQIAGKGQTTVAVKISFSRIERNISLNNDFTIPKNYKRITLAELIKSLGAK